MVESNPHAFNTQAHGNSQANTSSEGAGGKKKNKKKKGKSEAAETSSQGNQQRRSPDRIVTIKNPLFYNNPSEPMNAMMRNLQTPPFVSPMAEREPPPPASIIRNENGMYTIRNPTFQSAFGGNAVAPPFVPRPAMDPVGSQFSPNQTFGLLDDSPSQGRSQPKCSSVIGSEMKTLFQRRKEQEFGSTNSIDPFGPYGMRPQPPSYSHFGASGMNFSSNGTISDDSFMPQPSTSGFQTFQSPMMSNYDDLRLQPGQMLNSEVSFFSKNSLTSKLIAFLLFLGHNSQRL